MKSDGGRTRDEWGVGGREEGRGKREECFPVSFWINAHVQCVWESNGTHHIVRLLAVSTASVYKQRAPHYRQRRRFHNITCPISATDQPRIEPGSSGSCEHLIPTLLRDVPRPTLEQTTLAVLELTDRARRRLRFPKESLSQADELGTVPPEPSSPGNASPSAALG
jgi:hypothetical protein